MLAFAKGGKPEKNPQGRVEKQHKLNPDFVTRKKLNGRTKIKLFFFALTRAVRNQIKVHLRGALPLVRSVLFLTLHERVPTDHSKPLIFWKYKSINRSLDNL